MKVDSGASDWDLFCVYGPPYGEEKSKFWNQMKEQVGCTRRPWALIEDFNHILSEDEKEGGTKSTWNFCRILQDFLV